MGGGVRWTRLTALVRKKVMDEVPKVCEAFSINLFNSIAVYVG